MYELPVKTDMSPSNKNECRVIKGNEKKVKKLKVWEVSTNIQKKVFNVKLTNEDTHMITYTDKALENVLGYSSFDSGGCKMAKETRNQCVLVSVIKSVAFLLRTDKNVESVVEKLSSHFLDEGIMKKRAKKYPKEHPQKIGWLHAVALVFDGDGNGAIADPNPSKDKTFKTLKPETYVDCCSGVFGCYEVSLH